MDKCNEAGLLKSKATGLLIRAVALSVYAAGLIAAVITIHDAKYGWFVIGALMAIVPLAMVGLWVRQLTSTLSKVRMVTRTLARVHEDLVTAKNSGRYRCSPRAVEAWKALEMRRARNSVPPHVIEMIADTRRLVIDKGRDDGLAAGLTIVIYDLRGSPLMSAVELTADLIDSDRTFVEVPAERSFRALLGKNYSDLEVRLSGPAQSESGAGELERLIGVLLFEIEESGHLVAQQQ